ncbi:reverse transcriptase domain-containing protein, partial [Tanacetum coccineum]
AATRSCFYAGFAAQRNFAEVENKVLSPEAKEAAATIEQRLELGSKLSDIVKTKMAAHALLDLYKNQGYILTPHNGKVCVILKDVCTPQDMLKSMFHVSYLYWLEKNVGLTFIGVSDDCEPGGMLQISLEYVEREFNHPKRDRSSQFEPRKEGKGFKPRKKPRIKKDRIMSTSTHPIIVLSDFDVDDAFSSTTTPDYTPASPDYSLASPGNIPSDSSENLSKDLLASLTISPFHDDPYMKVMQAYNATSNELPIPLPQAPIAPPTILPPSPVISTLEMIIVDIQVIDVSYLYVSGITMVLLPSSFLEPLCPSIMDMINNQDIEHMIPPTPPPDYPFDKSIFAELDNSLWIMQRPLKIEPVPEKPNELDASLEAQAASMANTDNTNRNTRQRETPVARKYSYKEFMSCQPFNFKGSFSSLKTQDTLRAWDNMIYALCTCSLSRKTSKSVIAKLVVAATSYFIWQERNGRLFKNMKRTVNQGTHSPLSKKKDCKVKFATGTLTEESLSWWNSFAQPIGIEEAYKITWSEFKKLLIKKYCPRTEIKKMEDEFYNLTVKGNDLKTYVRRSRIRSFYAQHGAKF